jgi:hypothetical protein
MKLSDLSQKPKLIKIIINSEKIVKKYGEELEFHIYDRQPLDVFTKLANAKEDTAGITELIQNMILDENGKPVVADGNILPLDVIMEAVTLITDELGK